MESLANSFFTVEVLVPLILIPGTTAIGVAIKTCWDRYSTYNREKRDAIRTNQLNKLKNKLDFYWPLYMRLKRDKDIWEMVLKMSQAESIDSIAVDEDIYIEDDSKTIRAEIPTGSPVLNRNVEKHKNKARVEEKSVVQGVMLKLDEVVLKNHLETLEMIEQNIVSAEPRSDIAKLLMQYNRHVIMYKSLREEGNLSFPRKFGAPFPRELLPVVEERLFEIQKQYNDIVEYENDKLINKWKCKTRCDKCNRCSAEYCKLCRKKCTCAVEMTEVIVD